MAPPAMSIRIFLTCWLLYSLHWAPWIVREHFPAVTLAESGSLNVSRFLGWTIDIFPVPGGRAYINNNPGASVLGAIPVYLARPLLHEIVHAARNLPTPRPEAEDTVLRGAIHDGLLPYMLAAAFITLVGLSAPISALAASLLFSRLLDAGISQNHAALVAFTYAFATPVCFRTSYLNHNLLVCQLGLIAFLLLCQRPLTSPRLVVAGALAGYTVFCDFTGGLTVAALGCFLVRRGWRPALIFSAAALPGILALVITQWSIFGNPFLPSQHYMTPISITSQGYRGFSWPSPDLLWAILFQPAFGLFAWCPLLLLAFAAPFVRRVPHRAPAEIQALILGYSALCILFSSCNQYAWLQWNTGLRYLVPVIPGLLLLALQALQAFPKPLAVLLLLCSLLMSWSVAMTYRLHPLDSVLLLLHNGPTLPWLTVFRHWGWISPGHWSTWLPLSLCLSLLALVWLPRPRPCS